MKKGVLLFLFVLKSLQGLAQNTGDFSFLGYLESYYSYDFNQPDGHQRPDFLFNFNRHNEFSFNLALLKVDYQSENIRATVAFMAGTYAQYNLEGEPTWAQFVNEASVGVKLNDQLWFDVGIMPSHIGFESWYGMDCWHLSRSLLAENSPYFLTGGRLTYERSEKLTYTLWATNGWQNIQREKYVQGVGLGFGINYRPLENLELNYANYFGNEARQPATNYRFFNNVYAQYEWDTWGVTLGSDFGIQETYIAGAVTWYGVTASLKKEIIENLTLAGRAEYYSDPKAVILNTGMKVSGISANVDYQVASNALLRLEARQFFSPAPIFSLPGARFSRGNTALTTSLAVRF